jgi:hypothetical protein
MADGRVTESKLVAFYRGDGRDHRGRLLSHILGFGLNELEFNHDYIQWLFPLPEPSGANASAPLLSKEDITSFGSDALLRERLLQSFALMLSFFGLELIDTGGAWVSVGKAQHFDERRQVWLHAGNHNFLRISRILRSLTLLGCSRYATAFLECLEGIYAENAETIGSTTMGYWRRAVTTKI